MIKTNVKKIFVMMALLFIILSSTVAIAVAEQTVTPSLTEDNNIIVKNYVGIADTVKVSNLKVKDVIKVYDMDDNILGQATSISTSVTVKIAQLGTEGGTVYISVTNAGQLESERFEVSFPDEVPSIAPDASKIVITNNTGMLDTVAVSGLTSNDIVKVYSDEDLTSKLGQKTATSASTTVKISQLGTDEGTVYITVTSRGYLESTPTSVEYPGEAESEGLIESDITVVNNSGTPDTVIVKGSPGDLVKVYSDADLLGKAKVNTGAASATVRIKQLGSTAGIIHVTITRISAGQGESEKILIEYPGEANSIPPAEDDITVVNNVGISDTVTVKGNLGEVVKVYSDVDLKIFLGMAKVTKDAATVKINQLGLAAGEIYVTITSLDTGESDATEKAYDPEAKTPVLDEADITISNNVGVMDTVTVAGAQNDVVKVYSDVSLKTLLGKATVAKGATSATVNIKQLGLAAGQVYVTRTIIGTSESVATIKEYLAEAKAEAVDADNILIINNPTAAINDLVIVYGLAPNDVINVYSDSALTISLGNGTVAANETQVIIDGFNLPNKSGGTVYITRGAGAAKSIGTPKAYAAE